MVANTNQNRQFYVVTEILGSKPEVTKENNAWNEASEGSIYPFVDDNKTMLTFTHKGKGGVTRTDLIDPSKITYAKFTKASAMRKYQKQVTVKFSAEHGDTPIQGQDYILRIEIHNFLAPGDANVYVKSNAVRATKEMVNNSDLFWDAMIDSLERNFKREASKLLTFTKSRTGGIVVSEVTEQPWRLGVLQDESVNFKVVPTTVTLDGEEVIWGEVDPEEGYDYNPEEYKINGTEVADLEYFCMGERGDMFRNMGWPNNIDVKMMVDPTKEYDMLDVHYYFTGSGIDAAKSEKDITFVCETGKVNLKDLLKDTDVKVAEAPTND